MALGRRVFLPSRAESGFANPVAASGQEKILILVGSRQVGKSSLLYLMIESLIRDRQVAPTDIFYFNLDDLMLHARFERLPDFVDFVGRARQFEIQHLSFQEYLAFARPTTRPQTLEAMLVYGSYPAVAMTSRGMDKQLIIKDIYQSYVEKDLVDFLEVDNIHAFKRLLGLRNFALNVFSLLDVRSDVGKLFENFYFGIASPGCFW